MMKKSWVVALAGAALLTQLELEWSHELLAATSGALSISVTVTERCRIDFSEGSADYFQVCSAAQGVSNERSSNVLGARIAVDAESDPYFLDRDPDNPGREAGMPPQTGSPATAGARPARRGPKIVNINY